MAGPLRFFVRSAITGYRWSTRTSAATLRSCVSLNISRATQRRCLHDTISRAVASSAPASVSQTPASPQDDPNWRHPLHGFAVADYPRLLQIAIPHQTTEADMRVLLARAGLPDAQLTMFYQFTTGCSVSFCMMKLSDEKQATAAIQTLSRFTLFGLGLNPEKYDPEKFPAWRQPSLYAGWKPSPSSDLKSRVFRPPMTASPEILASLIAEKWVQFQDLPPVDPAKKGSYFDILHAFYKKFHQYDVVGITTVRKHENPPNGWCCKIQFGSPEEAKAALNSHVEAGVFLGRPAKAKIHRGGPNVHRELWAYRQSLPKDTPLKDVGALLEQKYREVIIEGRPSRQRSKYPTPESAVALKLALG